MAKKNKMNIASWVISALPSALLLMSAGMKIAQQPPVVEAFQKFGFNQSLLLPLGIIEALCTILYLVRMTSVMGAILLTGYLGGAICTHLHAGDSPVTPIVAALLVWTGIALRDSHLRAILPFRKKA